MQSYYHIWQMLLHLNCSKEIKIATSKNRTNEIKQPIIAKGKCSWKILKYSSNEIRCNEIRIRRELPPFIGFWNAAKSVRNRIRDKLCKTIYIFISLKVASKNQGQKTVLHLQLCFFQEVTSKNQKIKLEGFWSHFIQRNTTVDCLTVPYSIISLSNNFETCLQLFTSF